MKTDYNIGDAVYTHGLLVGYIDVNGLVDVCYKNLTGKAKLFDRLTDVIERLTGNIQD